MARRRRRRAAEDVPSSATAGSSVAPADVGSTSGPARPSTRIRFPSDVAVLAVVWRLRYKLSFRDVAEMLLERGYEFTHETVRHWEARFAPMLAERLRRKRRGRASVSWYTDETYVKVGGRWCYLYRPIDGGGQLIASMLTRSLPARHRCPGVGVRRDSPHDVDWGLCRTRSNDSTIWYGH
jgi:hypothetical protein